MDSLFEQAAQLLDSPAEFNQQYVARCLEFLNDLESHLNAEQSSDIVAISLQDMKLVNKMVRICIYFGVCPYLEPTLIIFHAETPIKYLTDPATLKYNIEQLLTLLAKKNDLSDVIRMTEFLPFVVAGAAQSDHDNSTTQLDRLARLISTFDLYKMYVRMLANKEAPSWFQTLLAQRLSLLPYSRKDALRAMIELFTGYREHDTIHVEHLDSLVDIFINPPNGKQQRQHVEVMDQQLFNLLGQPVLPQDITAAACHLANLLDLRMPQALMFVRNAILASFTQANGSLETGLMALTNLVERQKAVELVKNCTPQVLPMIWLVFAHLCDAKAPNGSTLKLLAALIDTDPRYIDAVIQNAVVSDINGLVPVVTQEPSVKVDLVEVIRSEASLSFELVDVRVDYVLTILNKVKDAHISGLFVSLLSQALSPPNTSQPLELVLKLKLLERIGQEFKDKLFSNPVEVVAMSVSVLSIAASPRHQKLEVKEEQDSDDEDDDDEKVVDPALVCLSLDLLNGVVLESFQEQQVVQLVRDHVPTIKVLEQSKDENISAKATYCLRLLDNVQDEGVLDLGDDNVDYDDSKQVFELAKSSINDPLVPVKAHGLQLIRKLVQRNDPVLNMDTALSIALRLLKDEDSYIYLNAVKTIEQCSQTYGPNSVVPVLLSSYVEGGDLDFLLRLGEILGRILEASAPAFKVETTALLIDALLSKVRVQNNQDDRIRVSAMSLLSLAVASNVHATTRYVGPILDCCFGILKMERDAPMLRSAMVALLEIVNHVNEGQLSLGAEDLDQIKTAVKVATSSSDEIVSSYAKDILAIIP